MNPDLAALPPSYLFAKISQKTREFKVKNPQAKLISLSVGDTSLPIPKCVSLAMEKKAKDLSTKEGYVGYGDEFGEAPLREKIAQYFYKNTMSYEEIFISDGAKCDLGRALILFDRKLKIGVPDPSYPVYFDASFALGFDVHYLPTDEKNRFLPKLDPSLDVVFLSSPNNPTGAAFTYEDFANMIAFAKKHEILLIHDAAYNLYLTDPKYPRSIFEVEGAKEVAIEIGSFSKILNFTGVRLGWSVVPKTHTLHSAWKRINKTFFNGASNIAQAGGVAALSQEGWEEMEKIVSYYKNNLSILKNALQKQGEAFFGGEHSPFLWIKNPTSSWDAFDHYLEKYHIIITPGVGFGPDGDHYIRFSSLGKQEDVVEATRRLCS